MNKRPHRKISAAAVILFVALVCRDAHADGWPMESVAPGKTALVPGFSVRNGDWLAVDGLGVLVLGWQTPSRAVALVARGEAAIAGVSAGIGLATNALTGPCAPKPRCDIDDFLGAGIISVEARAEQMYGPTGWHRTTYVGGQVSFAGIIFKPAIGFMVNPRDRRDAHAQVVIAGAGW
jgi:hypothetical protein